MTTQEAALTDVGEKPPSDARLMRHAYDGIREYDNPLPGWWSMIYVVTIVFAIGYAVFYHVAGWGQTPQQRYEAALASYRDLKGARDLAEVANVNEAMLAQRAADPGVLATGRATFVARCVACHSAEGQGLIGPNLTDLYQLHGSTRLDMFNTVKRGVPGTAMLAWGEQLSAAEVVAVTAYAITLRGKAIAGKYPEGAPVQAWTP